MKISSSGDRGDNPEGVVVSDEAWAIGGTICALPALSLKIMAARRNEKYCILKKESALEIKAGDKESSTFN